MSEENKNAYEYVNHPSHYNNYDMEVIDMMVNIWGKEATALWCEMTAFKYRMRMGTKPDNSLEQDLNKEKWYLNKKNEIKESLLDDVENWQETSYIKINDDNKSVNEEPHISFNKDATIMDIPQFTENTTQTIDVSYLEKVKEINN